MSPNCTLHSLPETTTCAGAPSRSMVKPASDGVSGVGSVPPVTVARRSAFISSTAAHALGARRQRDSKIATALRGEARGGGASDEACAVAVAARSSRARVDGFMRRSIGGGLDRAGMSTPPRTVPRRSAISLVVGVFVFQPEPRRQPVEGNRAGTELELLHPRLAAGR